MRVDVKDLTAAVGTTVGPSRWIELHQARIDAFASATEDRQWIHLDPERSALGPFRGTVAHGYLTLSLISSVLEELVQVEGADMTVNYGLDRVRFPAPVRAGARVNGEATLTGVTITARGSKATYEVQIGSEGAARPAVVATVLVLYAVEDATAPHAASPPPVTTPRHITPPPPTEYRQAMESTLSAGPPPRPPAEPRL